MRIKIITQPKQKERKKNPSTNKLSTVAVVHYRGQTQRKLENFEWIKLWNDFLSRRQRLCSII